MQETMSAGSVVTGSRLSRVIWAEEWIEHKRKDAQVTQLCVLYPFERSRGQKISGEENRSCLGEVRMARAALLATMPRTPLRETCVQPVPTLGFAVFERFAHEHPSVLKINSFPAEACPAAHLL
jgi:hypothetical protein